MPPSTFATPEELESRRRWPIAERELAVLVERIRDIHLRANPEPLPPSLAHVEKKTLLDGLIRAVAEKAPPDVSQSVVRRMANKIGEYLLWRRETSTPVLHELIALAPWWISHMPGEVFAELREIGLRYILNGRVTPLQTVLQDILDAPLVYIGHCACRSSRIVDDLLTPEGEVYVTATPAEGKRLLNRLLDRRAELRRAHRQLPDTDPHYVAILDGLADLRRRKSPDYRLEAFLRATYPHWEILPVLDKYTPAWIRSLHANHKAHQINKELAFEFALLLYLGKGIVFSAMTLFDTPYTICSCPTPDNNGGCVLTNWHYASGSDYSILVNEHEAHGQRRDAGGVVLPCDKFPLRAHRDCIGCGCIHSARDPRGVSAILREADAIRTAHGG